MVLIRHGKPAVASICYGQSDPELSQPAELTARTMREKVNLPDGQWYSSPSHRCLALARQLAPHGQVTPVAALRELDFGHWEQTPWSDVDRELLDAWAQQPLDYRIPGGESGRDLFYRVRNWAETAIPDQRSVIVAHAGSLRALAAVLLQRPFEQTWEWPVPYGTALQLNDRGGGFVAWPAQETDQATDALKKPTRGPEVNQPLV